MEFLFVIFIEILGEFLSQLFIELLFRSIIEPFFADKERNPAIAAVGYAVLGSVCGGLSLLVLPQHFVREPALRLVNLFLTPVLAGLAMAWLGRRRRGEVLRLDTFSFGFLFAFCIALVRYSGGK